MCKEKLNQSFKTTTTTTATTSTKKKQEVNFKLRVKTVTQIPTNKLQAVVQIFFLFF